MIFQDAARVKKKIKKIKIKKKFKKIVVGGSAYTTPTPHARWILPLGSSISNIHVFSVQYGI